MATESCEWESWLAAGKGTGILTLAVKLESGASEMVYSVVTIKTEVYCIWKEDMVVVFSFVRI